MSPKIINTEKNTDKHPDWYHDIPVMHTLILGSFPPHVSKRNYEFYYPNKQNNFWKILSAISRLPLTDQSPGEAVLIRKQIMERLCVGVENMGKTITREGNSSLDSKIIITEFHDVEQIIKKHKELKRIIIAGFSASSSTFGSFNAYLKSKNLKHTSPQKIKPGFTFNVTIDKRDIECVICNSTSTATRISLDKLIIQFSNYIRI